MTSSIWPMKTGLITMTCEFCKTDHRFELKKLFN